MLVLISIVLKLGIFVVFVELRKMNDNVRNSGFIHYLDERINECSDDVTAELLLDVKHKFLEVFDGDY